jgi:ParB family chromosome partitioning protein
MATDTIVRVDPKTLLVGANVRRDTKLSEEFVENIQELGVRIPITAYETPEGLVVVDGQRRTLAAVEANVTEVPVFVTAAPTEESRLVDQVVVNEQREGLEDSEHVAAAQQLALFDIPVPTIAKRLSLEESFVADAVKVGASPAAKKAYEKHEDLEAAVTIAEFEGLPEQAELLKLESSWQVRSHGRTLLEKRERAAIAEQLAADGVSVVKEPGYYDVNPQPLKHVFTEPEFKTNLADLTHERVVELAGDGLVAWVEWAYKDGRYRAFPTYGIKGWKELGLHVEEYRLRNATAAKASTPEEVEAAKVERRIARETTKAWVEATAARLVFLQGLVQRKAMPKGWEPVVAKRMLDSQGGFSTTQLKAMLAILQLPSGDSYSYRSGIQAHLGKSPTKAAQIALAVALGAVEGAGDFEKKGWDPKAYFPAFGFDTVAAYLKLLESWGHELTEVEKRAKTGKRPTS